MRPLLLIAVLISTLASTGCSSSVQRFDYYGDRGYSRLGMPQDAAPPAASR